MSGFFVWLFGAPVTPAEQLAKVVKDLKKVERVLVREANNAEREMLTLRVDVENLVEEVGIAKCEDRVRDRLELAEQERVRMRTYRNQAVHAKKLRTTIKVQESSVQMQRQLMLATRALIRFGSRLPNMNEIQIITKNYARSTMQQETVREMLGEAMEEATEDILEENGQGDSGSIDKQIQQYREAAGLGLDDELDNLPSVRVVGKARAATAVVATSSNAPPHQGGEDSENEKSS
jgi:hypothetical protein